MEEHEDGGVAGVWVLAKLVNEVETVESRHDHVENDEIGRGGGENGIEQVESLLAVRCFGCLETGTFEDDGDEGEGAEFVVND